MTQKLYIAAGGNNIRIGNHLPLFTRLMRMSNEMGYDLKFPRVEKTIIDIFSSELISSDFEIDQSQKEIDRFREIAKQKSASFKLGKFSIFDLIDENIRVIEYDGHISGEISREDLAMLLATPMNIVLKDPFPLSSWSLGGDNDIACATHYMSIRKDLLTRFDQFNTDRKMKISIHCRRGDFRHWQDGIYFYDDDALVQILESVKEISGNLDIDATLMVVSDEELPQQIMTKFGAIQNIGNIVDDFMTLATSRYIIRGPSTFARTAAIVGRTFLHNDCQDINLGTRKDLTTSIQKLCTTLKICSRECKPF